MEINLNKKGNRIFLIVLLVIISLGCLTGGLFMIVKNVKDRDLYEKTTATITRLEENYNHSDDTVRGVAYVSYEVDGVQYKDVRLSWYDSWMYKGKEITINYLKTNPYKVKSEKENYTVGAILLVMGVLVLVPAGYMVFEDIKKKL